MTEEEISKWAKKLITRFDNVKIIGAGGEWSGDARQGFMFNPRPISATQTLVTGACCFPDGSCSQTTSTNCAILGGTYQGNGTDCTDVVCPAPGEGACCLHDGVCVVESEAQCIADGGVFQGVGIDCIPNPCTENCIGSTAVIVSHATGSGSGCQTIDITDTITVTLPPGDGIIDFSQSKTADSYSCTPEAGYVGHASYLGIMFCEAGVFSLFVQGISLCCFLDTVGCSCFAANGEPGTMNFPGVYTFHFTQTIGDRTWNLDVTITITFP